MLARSEPQDKEEAFGDRAVRLETTFAGAGVLTGELTPECAEVVLILSFRVSRGCDLRRPVVDSVADGTFAA